MQIGISLFNGVKLENIPTLLKKHNISHTFIRTDHSDLHRAMALFTANGIVCDNFHAPFANINHMWSQDEAAGQAMLAQLTDAVDQCVRYNAPTVIVHLSSGRPMPEVTQIGLRRYERLFAYARERGVTVALENLRYRENLAFMLERYPECAFCWDCGHQYAYDHPRYLPEFGHRLGALHIHDNRAQGIDDHMLPFDGNAPMEQVARDIAESGYDGTLMLEVGREIPTGLYDHLTEEAFVDRAAAAAKKLEQLVTQYKR